MNDKDRKKLIEEMKDVFPTTGTMIEAMKEVFPTAEMVNKGFEGTATKEDLRGVKEDIRGVKQDLSVVKNDLRGVQGDLAAFKQETQVNFAYANSRLDAIEENTKDIIHHDEFDDLMARTKYVETKIGIESGK